MVNILRTSEEERSWCFERGVELRQCGDMVVLCERSRAVFYTQIGTIVALAMLLALEAWRKRRQNRPSKTVSKHVLYLVC